MPSIYVIFFVLDCATSIYIIEIFNEGMKIL